MLVLEVIEGPDRGRRFPLPPGEPQLLGRSSEAMPLGDRAISRRHAELTPDSDQWTVRDLNSSNGTFVNGSPAVGTTAIGLGDTIACGRTQLRMIETEDIIAGPARDTQAARRAAPPCFLPPSSEVQGRVLAMLWSIAASEEQSDTLQLPAFCSSLAAAIQADAVTVEGAAGEHSIRVPISLGDRQCWIVLDFGEPPEPWCQGVAELAVWLLQTIDEARRVGERDRLAAMGETIAVVSHAIKNILQGLQGGAGAIELAIERGDLQLAREGWPILSRNLDRIHDLTFNMLAWSRTSHLDIEPGSLASVVDDVVALQQPTFSQRRVRLEHASGVMADVPFDAASLHQALLNLVLNALEAVPARSGEVRIETGVDEPRSEAFIAVIDNGPGVPVGSHASIFEPFASSRGQRGTGLGLAVTRRIAAAHGGRVVLQTKEGKGSRFEIRLPLHVASGDPGDTDVPPPASMDSGHFGPRERLH